MTTTRIILTALSAITKTDPILFQNLYLSLSISMKAFGFFRISKYIIPGIVKDIIERPNAPTKSKTAAMLSMKTAATMHAAKRRKVSK